MNGVVFVVGPTACGKSALALKLAERFHGSILNCDSLQVYRRLDIGTAKPPAKERSIVPHLLFDFVDPGQTLTAGDFRTEALNALHAETAHRSVFAVGGSGFYIQALEKGLFDVPKATIQSEERVRQRLNQKGLEEMYRELQKADPEYAEEISPNDSYRVVRALVVYEDTGKKMSELKRSFKPEPFPYPLLKLGLDLSREQLLPRVSARVDQMLEQGFLNEVERLMNEGYGNWAPLRSVGYQECVDHLEGKLPKEKLATTIVEKTLQLSKKQRTWFKRDREIHWLPFDGAFGEAERLVSEFLDRSQAEA